MAKTQEELNELKNEYETINGKLKELSDDELLEVTGGSFEDLWEIIKKMGEKMEKKSSPTVTPITPLTQPK